MAWLSVTASIFYYLSLPLTILLGWILIALAPVLHLGHYLVYGFLLPLRLLVKFETLYIYLGVAAVIGLITGSILHVSSSILVSLFNLTPVPEEARRSAASVRAAKERKQLEHAWQSSAIKSEQVKWGSDISLERYADWVGKDAGQRREDQGVRGQTIIEEDDDSEVGF